MTTPESRPELNYPKDISSAWGIVPIEKGSDLWKRLNKGADYIIDCFNQDGGFSQQSGGPSTLWSTRMGLEGLWWSQTGLGIDNAIARFKKAQGEDVFEKTVDFVSSRVIFDKESKNGQEILVAGFLNDDDRYRISSAATHEGLKILFSLEENLGQKGSIAKFEEKHPQAFGQFLNFVDCRYLESKEISGFAQVRGQPIPDVWGTHASLEIVKLLASHRHKQHPEEAAGWVRKTRERTPKILNLLHEYQDPNGGYGFSPNSHPNVFSTWQAVHILKGLFFFNNPAEYESEGVWSEFLYNNAGYMKSRMLDFLESMRAPGDVTYYGIRHTSRDFPLKLDFTKP